MAKRIVPVKDRDGTVHTFANVATANATAKAVKVKVTKETEGPVTWAQKAKGYYKGIIALITGLLVVLNELTPVMNSLPGQDKQYLATVIVIVGTSLTILKSNEHWVDEL
jgi:nicotinamide riboside transporter PnuC